MSQFNICSGSKWFHGGDQAQVWAAAAALGAGHFPSSRTGGAAATLIWTIVARAAAAVDDVFDGLVARDFGGHRLCETVFGSSNRNFLRDGVITACFDFLCAVAGRSQSAEHRAAR